MPALAADEGVAEWSTAMSAKLYNVDGWGAPYYFINSAGDVAVRPLGDATLPGQEIDLMKVVNKAVVDPSAGGLGLRMPVIVRFPDVLRHRLESLHAAFQLAVDGNAYGGFYQGVYPVKCNQDRHVVEDIAEFGSKFRFGLEAGSKPELLLAMSCLVAHGSAAALLVCNGYKDAEYVELALMARTMGIDAVVVLEQEDELDAVLAASRRLGVRPVIGFRAKLRTKHAGHFGSTSGEKGKFGLTTAQILGVVDRLRRLGMLDCLQLLHFHIGSQIPTTALLADGVGEAAQIYCELARLGAGMRVMDVGGGLGVDYDGSRSAGSDMSVGYTLEEYAFAVVQAVRRVCDARGVAHPVLCSESGRALVSHHSVLVFEAFAPAMQTARAAYDDTAIGYILEELPADVLADYHGLIAAALRGNYDMSLRYAEMMKKRSIDLFKDGVIGLEHLAAVDGLCEIVALQLGVADQVRTYNINLSVFTSVPDFWGIGQLFPILPIHRLDERPAVAAVLSDLTCDSDGKIDRFIGGKSSLPLHELGGSNGGRCGGYYLGMFLGGAYQEALGGVHNLFGSPSMIRVSQSDGPHGFAVTRAVSGRTCADLLRSVQHEPEFMFSVLKMRAMEHRGGAAVARALSSAFDSMPYLMVGPDATCRDCSGSDSEGSVVTTAGVGEDDDDEWDLMRCLAV